MDLRLDGKNAIVCGSSQGLGKSVALQFSEMGANVILLARNEKQLEKTLKELPKNNSQNHRFIAVDFSQPDNTIIEIKNKLTDINPIHILVNNAGGPKPGEINKADSQELVNAFNSHIVMSQMLVQYVLPGMKEAGFGRIINIISVGMRQPIDHLGVSNTIRGAMGSWSKTLSREVARFGITVNNLLPGQTKTSRLDSLIENNAKLAGKSKEEITIEMISQIPAGRLGEPEDFAYAAGFLASEQASFITGISLPVDGGFLRCL